MTIYNVVIQNSKTPLAVILSFIVALVLTIIPLPDTINFLRPEWVVLLLICWILKSPLHIGVIYAFLIGFFLDSLYNFPLGIHSFALILSVYLLLKFMRRFEFFSFWQKVAVIFGIVFIYELPSLFYELSTSHLVDFKIYFIPMITSALIWPVVVFLLDIYCDKLNLE